LFSEEVTALRSQLEDSAKSEKVDSDAMYHLQVAQATLNERYSKLQKKNAELQKYLDQTIVKLVNCFVIRCINRSHRLDDFPVFFGLVSGC